MSFKDMPFNIWLLNPDNKLVARMRPVTTLERFDSSGNAFHPDGLYSTEIFGALGSDERDTTFSYIRLNCAIIHPQYFTALKQLKGLYAGVMSGRRYAVWDDKEKDLVPSTPEEGRTGYAFFMECFPKIVFKRNNSDERNETINVIEKYRETCAIDRYLVSPAGIRDIHAEVGQRPTEDEVNDLYRKLLMTSSTVSALDEKENSPSLDTARWSLQVTAVAIYRHYINLISGKTGWMQAKYGARATRNGTRNVITSMSTATKVLGAPNALSMTNTEVGLMQTARGAAPITIHGLLNGILGDIFGAQNDDVWLTNPKTLHREIVKVPTEVMDAYGTKEGLDKLITRFKLRDARNSPIIVEGYFVGLLYTDEKYFKIFKDIDELPEGFKKDKVTPLTLADVIYLSCYQAFKRLGGTCTRYPVTGEGSIYPTIFRVRTTVQSSEKLPLDDNWEPMPEQYMCPAFHDRSADAAWMDSLVVHVVRIKGLGADFDGDTASSPFTYTREAFDEIVNFYKRRTSLIGANGKFLVSPAVDTVQFVIAAMTGDPED